MSAGDAVAPRAVVERMLDGMARGDVELMESCLGADVTWEVLGADYQPMGARFEGRAAVMDDFFGATAVPAFDWERPFDFEVRGTIGEGPTLAAEVTIDAHTSRGRPYRNTYCFVFDVEDGAIRAVREYTNTEYAKRVLFSR